MSHATESTSKSEREDAFETGPFKAGRDSLESVASECVSERPITSAVVSLAAGIGVGMLVGSILGGSSGSRERVANRIGRQMMDSFSSAVPEYFK